MSNFPNWLKNIYLFFRLNKVFPSEKNLSLFVFFFLVPLRESKRRLKGCCYSISQKCHIESLFFLKRSTWARKIMMIIIHEKYYFSLCLPQWLKQKSFSFTLRDMFIYTNGKKNYIPSHKVPSFLHVHIISSKTECVFVYETLSWVCFVYKWRAVCL